MGMDDELADKLRSVYWSSLIGDRWQNVARAAREEIARRVAEETETLRAANDAWQRLFAELEAERS